MSTEPVELPAELYLLDTETASFKGGICEFAYLKIDHDLNVLSEFRTLVNPERPIEEGAFKVHGISDADVADAPTMAQIAAGHFDGPIYMVGHNVSFDKRMLAGAVEASDTLCSLSVARQFISNTTNHKLEVLQDELNLPKQQSHSALGDCHTVRDLLLYIGANYGMSFPTLLARNAMPKLIHKMPFGKHKGKPLNRLPKDFIIWTLENMEIDKDLRYSLEQLRHI